ncbi:MAG: heme-binding domain-containing protein [candidate division KSB1 bacterium]|nr:heme-binding domain-containing protein [candidate division KSB1 bacterium]MDZ7274005.1 heme-binding domain-containing protein [candidate division KSB1 bacterium]MDZ7286378.1 heme-binding domain-containing protein [candidate division KSB1 bacterium]MDZ7296606.1 heme-binding domain-containing protein [candidate division KSB1 bacterium]MDZ7309020.1 heme-binding domain-containing protein [candidate division KSB1 bacterium]
MAKVLKIAGMVLIAFLVGAQFVRPARTTPTVDQSRTLAAQMAVPAKVQNIFDRACRDCHSHQTTWPWYSNVAPASWLVINHVNEGRRHLNFSDWAKYTPKQARHKLEEICEVISSGEMPLKSYLLLHPDAKLTPAEVETLCAWTKSAHQRLEQESPDEQ